MSNPEARLRRGRRWRQVGQDLVTGSVSLLRPGGCVLPQINGRWQAEAGVNQFDWTDFRGYQYARVDAAKRAVERWLDTHASRKASKPKSSSRRAQPKGRRG